MTLKILFMSHNFSPFIGGIEIISQMLAKAFTREGHQVHLLTWTKDATTETFPFKVIRNPGLVTLLKEHGWADIVFENNPCLRLSWPGLFFRRPSVISLQTWVSRSNGRVSFKDKIKLRWLKRADKVISCSTAIQKQCFPESLVIPNPYRENLFHVDPSVHRDKEFIFLGRMVSDKGAQLAIKAFYIMCKDNLHCSGFKLTMVGEGPERKNLEDLVSTLNLKDQVTFTGALSGENLVKCLNRHKILLVPSIWKEPFGIVVLEGMACGCIPIVSDGGGLPEAAGDVGYIFRRSNIRELVRRMEAALSKNSDDIFHRKAASHLAGHTSSVVATKYLDVIHTVYKEKPISSIQDLAT